MSICPKCDTGGGLCYCNSPKCFGEFPMSPHMRMTIGCIGCSSAIECARKAQYTEVLISEISNNKILNKAIELAEELEHLLKENNYTQYIRIGNVEVNRGE